MATSPTQRTIQALKREGCVCGIAEKWNAFVPRGDGGMGMRQDLLGFIDVVACSPDRGILAIQAAGTGGMSSHVHKILDDCTENAMAWLQSGGRIEIWEWRKVKLKRGGKAMRWQPRVREITLADFTDPPF